MCFELVLWALAPWGCLQFIILTCQDFKQYLVIEVIPNSLVDLEANLKFFFFEEMMVKMKQEMLVILFIFHLLLIVFTRKKWHNILAMMLDPKFTNICLINSYVGQKSPIILVVEYDKQLLLPLFVKCYKLLMSIVIEEHQMAL